MRERSCHAVVLLGNAVPTAEQRLRAALLHGGEGAMITALWALRLHGLRQFAEPGDVHVLVPANRTVIDSRFVTVERTTRLPASHTRLGFPVAPVPRAVLDAARRSTEHDDVLAMMSEAVQRRRCTALALSEELRQGSQRGSAVPRRALAALLGGARSVAEADAWNLWQGSGLPLCQWNVKIFDRQGRYIATPDAWVDELGFAWEIDSRNHHSEDDDFADTLSRNARYVTAGVLVLQTLPSRLRTEAGCPLGAEMNVGFGTTNVPNPTFTKRTNP